VWTERRDRFHLTENDVGRIEPSRLVFDWLTFNRRPNPIIVVESDVQAIQMRWLQHIFRRSCFVGVVRNGYAVAEALRLKEGYTIERCAMQWSTANDMMLADAQHVHNFMLVRYEQLVDDPRPTVERIARFIDVDPSPLMPFIVTGWPLGNGDPGPSPLRNANPDHLARLSPAEAETVTRVARGTLDALDYPVHGKPFPRQPVSGNPLHR
jgi:hypothetical protein